MNGSNQVNIQLLLQYIPFLFICCVSGLLCTDKIFTEEQDMIYSKKVLITYCSKNDTVFATSIQQCNQIQGEHI